MVHYLRFIDGRTLAEVETADNDISVAIDLALYSEWLILQVRGARATQPLINDFDNLNNLREPYQEYPNGQTADVYAETAIVVLRFVVFTVIKKLWENS